MAANYSNETIEIYWEFENAISLFSIVFLSLTALGTVLLNGFALFSIYKDPLNCFRTTLSTFMTGILVSNFLTGLIVEPVFAFLYGYWYIYDEDEVGYYMKLIRISQIISRVTINTSFMTVLMLALAQLIGLKWSSAYVKYFTPRLASIILVGIWVYAIFFALIPEIVHMDSRHSYENYFRVDLIMHTSMITVSLVVIYIATYFVFQKAILRYEASLEAEQGTSEQENHNTPKAEVEREFVKGTFIVIIVLIVTIWPVTIMLYIWSYQRQNITDKVFIEELIAFVVCEDFMFLKFLLDPLIFVWRLPKYRKALGMVFRSLKMKCGCARASLPQAEYHQANASDADMHFADEEFMVETDSITNPALEFETDSVNA
ncbi:predicted protein [Nematostella vectensis]|uniref:G-protein coupled receptors family 1 profile domain-containing protein n=1 Tax=Nematostella vectensis TaxID=45351 RepID=A7SA37_NEMVE|nr:predicted protein [Nematostella vectensis]|eukprot:XP_001631486.1 predicted protein [Nematostella vectensis]